MDLNLKTSIKSTESKNNLWLPEFFRLSIQSEKDRLFAIIKEKPYIQVFDELQSQLEELVKSLFPKTAFSKSGLKDAAKEYLGLKIPEEYGVWVYYPWSERIVHLLDETEFVEVRTNRNQYKITPEERELLAQKKIGVIGLSVGQSVALTMAMERSFGELRIADYDILELSNLNRIRSGVHNFKISKVICVAREIAEIDPYLKVVCYHEGIFEENLENYLTEGGKLDLLIEECDSLYVKVIARTKARELGIPVVMDTSDKGMIDIERFDLEPERPVLHGLIDHLDISQLKFLKTNEEKVPYVLPIIGVDTISKRMKASMLEIEQSITTWPQLSSAVALGGGITADVCRRILLNQLHVSGRFFIDLEKLISDNNVSLETSIPQLKETEIKPLNREELIKLVDQIPFKSKSNNIIPNSATIEDLILNGILAPSAGNNQPWKFLFRNGILFLFHDKFYSESFGDYDDIASYVGLGAVIENIIIKSHSLHFEVLLETFPLSTNKTLIASFTFFNERTTGTEPPLQDNLVKYIPLRFTNRNYGPRKAIDKEILGSLQKTVSLTKGAEIQFLESDNDLNEIGEIIASADKLRFLHLQAHHEFFHKEIRWNKTDNEKYRDGLDISTFDLTVSEKAALKIASDQEVISYLIKWKGGDGFKRMSLKAVKSAGAVGLITMPEYSSINFLNGGRAAERLWLMASQNNISIQPLFSPPLFFTRLIQGKGKGMQDFMRTELKELRERYVGLFNLSDNHSEVFLFRMCHCEEPEIKSLRKSMEHFFIV